MFYYFLFCYIRVAKITNKNELRRIQPSFFLKIMIKDYLKELILRNFGFLPTGEQEEAIDSLCDFVLSPDADEVFLLRGYAGTGKTSLVGAFVKTMEQLNRRCVLVAPTGRAAKVFSLYAEHPAFTIHRRIYRQKTIDKDSAFSLNYNSLQNALFISDEASMIANDGLSESIYGTGRLLDDLMQFVYSGTGCRLVLLGDTAQLPPVGETESPALQPDIVGGYGMNVRCHTLTHVVRQRKESGILWNATCLRQAIDDHNVFEFPKVRFGGFTDVKNVPGNELIETISSCYAHYGVDETMVVCRSNKRAHVYNNGIRNQILGCEEELSSGDILMVAKNNYFWISSDGKDGESKETAAANIEFIANGDVVVVERVRNIRELYGFHFADCQLRLPDYDDYEFEATVLLDTLHSEAPSLTREQNDALFNRIMEDYMDIPTKRERMKKMMADPYFNALQIKYAYAVTCHKAQGGQWSEVFIDQGYMTEDMLGPDYYRWLYTAFTRATHVLYLVNWREEQTLHIAND